MNDGNSNKHNDLAFYPGFKLLYKWPEGSTGRGSAWWIFSFGNVVQLLLTHIPDKSYKAWSLILFIKLPWWDLQRFSFEHRYSE